MAAEHVSLTFRYFDLNTDKALPWTSASQGQMEAVRDLQNGGFECVGVTTLADGSLYLMFKRPKMDEQRAIEIAEQADLSVGQYL